MSERNMSRAPRAPGKHDWWVWRGMTCCKKCGIIRRRDGKNKACRGVVKVALREREAIDAR